MLVGLVTWVCVHCCRYVPAAVRHCLSVYGSLCPRAEAKAAGADDMDVDASSSGQDEVWSLDEDKVGVRQLEDSQGYGQDG